MGKVFPPSFRGVACKDHTGRDFPSYKAMALHWGVTPSALICRLINDWGLEEALTTKVGDSPQRHCTDHQGNEYYTQKEMCEHWGISYGTFASRKAQGWSIKKALTTPLIKNGK